MLYPPGFEQQTLSTSLGDIVYSTTQRQFWGNDTDEAHRDQKPTLIFLHGFGGGSSSYEWSKVYPAFADEYRIIAPDLLGWGASAHPPSNYRVEDYLAVLTEFMTKIVGQPATVIASSLSAAFMIRLATMRPDLLKSLVLIAPAGLKDFGRDDTDNFFTQLVNMPVVDRLIYASGIANEVAIRSFLEQKQFAHPERVYSEIVQAYLSSAQQTNAEYSALSFVRGDLSFDLSDYIEDLQTPTAILWGKDSNFTKPEVGQRLASLNKNAVKLFQVIEDVGLTPQLEMPAVTIGLIKKSIKLLDNPVSQGHGNHTIPKSY